MCERFEDASVIQTVASYIYKDTLRPSLERHSMQSRKEPDNDYKIVLLWLLSKTIVNVSYVLYRCGTCACASNHFSTVRFVFEERRHNFVCCNWPSSASAGIQEIWKSYSAGDQQRICQFACALAFLSHKVTR